MRRKIVIRSDASTKGNRGVGVAYEATVYHESGGYDRYSESRYIPAYMKTTDAETVAAAFGIMKMYEQFDDQKEQYELILESDCEPTIEDIQESFGAGNEVERVIRFFATSFKGFSARWISRENNEKADALAREALRVGDE